MNTIQQGGRRVIDESGDVTHSGGTKDHEGGNRPREKDGSAVDLPAEDKSDAPARPARARRGASTEVATQQTTEGGNP